MKLRIGFVVTTIETGGAETMLLKLVRALDKQHFDAHVVVLGGRAPLAARFEQSGIQVTALGTNRSVSRLTSIARAPKALSLIKPHVLQGWMLHGNLAAQIAGTILRIPVLWSVRHSKLVAGRDNFSTIILERTLSYISRLPVGIVYNSNEGRVHHERLGYNASRSVVIANGFDVAAFCVDEAARWRLRHALGIPPETVLIGMIARYHPIKDHTTFLRAASMLKPFPQVRFMLVGAGCSERNTQLRATIHELGLQESILLLGERSDITAVGNALDIGVLSSISEGFPNVLGELMACGVPCVVTDVGDCRSIVGATGITVAPQNPAALAHGLESLIRADHGERKRLGREARSRIVSLFSIDVAARAFEDLYVKCAI